MVCFAYRSVMFYKQPLDVVSSGKFADLAPESFHPLKSAFNAGVMPFIAIGLIILCADRDFP
jgi:hypothetical protein